MKLWLLNILLFAFLLITMYYPMIYLYIVVLHLDGIYLLILSPITSIIAIIVAWKLSNKIFPFDFYKVKL